MELQLLLSGLSTVITIGLSGYFIVCLAWCTLLVVTINKVGRPRPLKNASGTVVTLGVVFHAVCWPHSMKTVYERQKRRR